MGARRYMSIYPRLIRDEAIPNVLRFPSYDLDRSGESSAGHFAAQHRYNAIAEKSRHIRHNFIIYVRVSKPIRPVDLGILLRKYAKIFRAIVEVYRFTQQT